MGKPPIETLDIAVGVMVESTYGWHEYCNRHGAGILSIYPDRNHRDICLYEILVAHREYQCHACNELIWDQNHHKENSNELDLHRTE